MVKSCIVCKKKYEKNSERSFHLFPSDDYWRKQWFSKINMQFETTKYVYLCSDHFSAQDFIIKPSGHKFLKINAIPSVPSSSFTPEEYFESPVSISPAKTNTSSTLTAHSPSKSSTLTADSASSSSTLTADSPVKDSFSSIERLPLPSSRKRALLFDTDSSTTSALASESEVVPRKKTKISPPRYFGDCHSDQMKSPKSKRNWLIAKKTILEQRRKIRNLQQSRRCLKSRIFSMKSLMNYLKKQMYISEAAETTINASLPGTSGEIMQRILKGPSREKYSPLLRSFALTLNFYSSKGYNFVRNTFNNSLPHPRTLTKWYQTIDGSPGFTKEALEALKVKVAESALKNRKVLCNLVMDEMSIRSQVEWTGKKFTGYVDLGSNLDSDNLEEAKEVLVFMLVALNDNWKIPIGYFLLNGLNGMEKANVVLKLLEFLNETDVIVTSITFDGAAANLSMASVLGADLQNHNSLTTYFKHPITNHNIYIFLDPCHMLKLLRNCLASQGVLEDDAGNKIEWKYIECLANIQNIEGLHAATKLKNRHIRWEREKMKVKLAAQTFSKSVADALIFCGDDLHLPDFQDSEATARFCEIVNNLFDIFNCRNIHSKSLMRKPLSPHSQEVIFNFLDATKNYIKNLKLRGESVLHSGRKTGFLGFLVCIESLKLMYQDYVNCENPLLKYILTYKLSQDHLEIFFSAVRSKGGSNNNPTARQFEGIYKRLLIHTEIRGADTANAIALDSTSILHCTSSSITKNENGEDMIFSQEYLDLPTEIIDHDYLTSQAWHLTDFTKDIVAYIAGFVVKSVKKCITCQICINILEDNESLSLLQIRKTYGKLTKASQYVVDVCRIGEKCFRFFTATKNMYSKKYKNLNDYLVNSSIKNIDPNLLNVFGDHIFDDEPLSNHSLQLSKIVLKKYFHLRIHHETVRRQSAKDLTENRVRSMLTKTITFKNQ